MAESGLSVGLPELIQEVGFFLDLGRADHTAPQLAEIMSVIQSGVRRVYYPMAVNQATVGYEWSWLKPTTTIDTEDGVSDYDLPDDFGRLHGDLFFGADEYRMSIPIVPIATMLQRRAVGIVDGAPIMAAYRHKVSDGSSGQRQELMLWPTPDAVWTLSYQYEAYSGALSDTYPYPLGGMKLAELYIESCLAVAESRLNEEVGLHSQAYQALLIDAIARDKNHGPKHYGQMGHIESTHEHRRRGQLGSSYPITYNGDLI